MAGGTQKAADLGKWEREGSRCARERSREEAAGRQVGQKRKKGWQTQKVVVEWSKVVRMGIEWVLWKNDLRK